MTRIGAEATVDTRTGSTCYVVRITPSEQDLTALGDFRLLPGMPVEGFVQTGDRKVISYLLKPMAEQVARAFRER